MASRSFTIQTGIGPRGPQGPPGDGGGGSWDTITGGAANYVPMDVTPTSIPTTEGTVSWNADDHTLNIATDISGVVLQVGQEQHVRIRNVSGSTIANGSVVYLSGSSGQRPTVDLADADNDTHVASTIGLATADVTNNSFGFVTTGGLVRGVNTAGMTEGAPIYLSTTAGAMTQTAPTSNIVRVGFCIVAGNNGTVLVHVEKMSMDTFNELTVNGAATFNDSIDFNDGTIVGMTAAAKTDWKSTLDIGNVDNTSDATKNSATATLTNKTIDAANNTLSGTASGLVTGGSVIGIITESTTARTLSGTDIHKKIRYTNASGCAITIPNGIGVAGTIIIGRRATGAGALSFTLGGSVTVNNSGISAITAGQEFALMALSANEYDFI